MLRSQQIHLVVGLGPCGADLQHGLPMAVLPSMLALSRFILLARASTWVISSMVCIRAVLASRARVRLARYRM